MTIDKSMKDMQLLSEELDLDLIEINKLSNDIDFIEINIERWMIFSEKLEKFIEIIELIEKTIPQFRDEQYSFFRGLFWSNIISTYEGYIHEILPLILISNDESEKQHEVRLKKFTSKVMYHPYHNANTLQTEFELSNLTFCKKRADEIIKIRNAYTHNNGLDNNGSLIEISLDDLNQLINEILTIINMYHLAISTKSDEQLQNILGFSFSAEFDK